MASLVETLARRLGTSPSQAREHLQALLTQFRAQAKREGHATLPGLGTFSLKNGTWTFKPDDALARSANRSFQHLAPVGPGAQPSGQAAFPSAPSPEERPFLDRQEGSASEPALDIFAPLPSDPRERPAGPSKTAPPTWDYAALPTGYLVHRRLPLSPRDLQGGRLYPLSASPAKERASDSEEEPGAEEKARPLGERRATPRTSETPSRRPDRTTRSGRPHRSSSPRGSGLRWLAALLALAVVGLGIWYVVGQQASSDAPPPPPNEGAPEKSDGTPPANPDPDDAPGGAGAGGAGADAETSPPRSAQALPGEQTYADARPLDTTQGGWTVVVASEMARFEAEQAAHRFAQRFQDRGYPVDILASATNGAKRFRVVVGQFPSADRGTQAIQQSTEAFPDDAWLLEVGSE